MADTQRGRREATADAGGRERPDRTPSDGANRVPWRVEGDRRDGKGPQRPGLFRPRFWVWLVALLVLNWVLSALLVRPPDE